MLMAVRDRSWNSSPAALLHRIAVGVGGIGRAQYRAAQRQYAGDVVVLQLPPLVPHQPVIAILNSNHFSTVLEDRFLGHRPDDGVDAGAVSASGKDGDSLLLEHGQTPFVPQILGVVERGVEGHPRTPGSISAP